MAPWLGETIAHDLGQPKGFASDRTDLVCYRPAPMGAASSTSEIPRVSAGRQTAALFLALAVALQGLWLPAHLALDPHTGDGHAHGDSAQRARAKHGHGSHGHHGHGHHAQGHRPHAHHDHDHAHAHGPRAQHERAGDGITQVHGEEHSPHEPHHPITDHQPPVVANLGVSAPILAPPAACARLPELQLLARVRARPPPPPRGDPAPHPSRPRAPPSV